ncbi:hypothetical protein DFH09DRAFT_1281238 [Mycena vulgaris]|nr:hypothetical protein DFH09DRAFT_1281238 [Mycena vulgaris]
MPNDLQKSDTQWLDPHISSHVLIRPFLVTKNITVNCVEYLKQLPSIIPIPEVPTVFFIDLDHLKFAIIDNKGKLHSADALIKITTCGPDTLGLGTQKSQLHLSQDSHPSSAVALASHAKEVTSASALILDFSKYPDAIWIRRRMMRSLPPSDRRAWKRAPPPNAKPQSRLRPGRGNEPWEYHRRLPEWMFPPIF